MHSSDRRSDHYAGKSMTRWLHGDVRQAFDRRQLIAIWRIPCHSRERGLSLHELAAVGS